MTTSKKKRCRICGKRKPLKEFYAAESMKDGRRSECRTCFRVMRNRSAAKHKKERRAQQRVWYRTHRDYFRKYKRRYHREHREHIKAYFKKYYDEHWDYFHRKKLEYRRDKKKLARMKAYNKEWGRRKRLEERKIRAKAKK